MPGRAPTVRNSLGAWSALSNPNNLFKLENQTNHGLAASSTKVAGRWTFKLGGEFRNYLANFVDPEQAVEYVGAARFTGQLTDDRNNAPSGAPRQAADVNGFGPASWFFGIGNFRISPGRDPLPALSAKYFALYSQNDWKVSNRLTLNLGLRWEIQPGPTERFNRLSSVDLTRPNPFKGQGLIAIAGTGGYSRSLWDTVYDNVGPRLGAAYRLNDKTVLRGGYGITYLPTNTGYFGSFGRPLRDDALLDLH
ncbi:MAG: TonB-dependent receptor domain-containing protein [Blastocatellia bacterium]